MTKKEATLKIEKLENKVEDLSLMLYAVAEHLTARFEEEKYVATKTNNYYISGWPSGMTYSTDIVKKRYKLIINK